MKNQFITHIAFWVIILFTLMGNTAYSQGWQWAKESSSNGVDAWPVATDLSGNIFVAGYTLDDGRYTFDTVTLTATNNPQIIVAKYNNSGSVLWAKIFLGGTSLLTNIATDHSGNVIVLGIFSGHITADTFNLHSNPVYNTQYFIVKLDASGNVIWADTSAESSSCSDWSCLGAYDFPGGHFTMVSWGGITTDSSDNIYITGNFNSPTTIGSATMATSGSDDIFVAKYNPSGTPVWASRFGGSASDDAYCIAVSSLGNVYVSGSFSSHDIAFGSFTLTNPYVVPNAYLAEFSPSGAPLWARSTGGSYGSVGSGLAGDGSGNIYWTGGFGNDTIPFGSRSIIKTYTGRDNLLELFALRLSSADSVTMVKTIGSPTNSIIGNSIAVSPCGQVWVAGIWTVGSSTVLSTFIHDSANVDGHIMYTPDSSIDPVFVAGYNPGDSVIGYAPLQGGADDQVCIALDNRANLFICGDYQNAYYTNFIVGRDTLHNPEYGSYYENLYIAKYLSPDTGCTGGAIGSVNNHIDTSFCVLSDTTTITLTVPSGTGYLWYDGATTSSHILYSSGTYWVSFYSGPSFIVDTFYVTFASTSPPCPTVTGTGVSATPAVSGDVQIFPNPADDELTIKTGQSAYNSLSITNDLGQQLIQQQITSSQTTVNMQSLPPGMYYITLRGENGNMAKKFVKM